MPRKARQTPGSAKHTAQASGVAGPPQNATSGPRRAASPYRKAAIPLDCYGFRVGSKKSQAAALYEQGATLADVTSKVGSPQLSILSFLQTKGYVVLKEKLPGVKNSRGPTKYTLGGRHED